MSLSRYLLATSLPALFLFAACDTTATPAQMSGVASPVEPICGNGIVEGYEECDLGQAKNGQPDSSCTFDCLLTGGPPDGSHCGDGIVEGREQCDLGRQNGAPGSPCGPFCLLVQ